MDHQAAAMYVRISKDPLNLGLGIARQEHEGRELADRLGWTVTQVYSDNDISAYSGKRRPQFELLLEAMACGSVKRVVVWHHDRLTRDPRDLERYLTAAEQGGGVVTQTVTAGHLDLATPSGRATARTITAWARYESEHKAERQIAKEKELARAGALTGGPRPYGWRPNRKDLDPAEHAVIAEMATRVIAGESLRGIASDLNARGLRTSTGKLWQPTIIRSMLVRPRLAGLREYRGEIVCRNAQWEPALPMHVWTEIRAVLMDPSRRTGSNARRWLLTGIAKCERCDQKLTLLVGAASRPVTSRVAYRCRHCGTSRSALPLDALVTGAVIRRLETLPAVPVDDVDPAVAADLEHTRTRLQQAADAYARDEMTLEQLTHITTILRSKLAQLEVQATPARRRAVLTGVHDPRKTWGGLPLDRRRAIVAELIEVSVLPVGAHAPRAFDPSSVQLRFL